MEKREGARFARRSSKGLTFKVSVLNPNTRMAFHDLTPET